MNSTDFENHEVHKFLASLIKKIASFNSEAFDEIDSLSPETKQLEYLKWCFDKSDGELFIVQKLDATQGVLVNVDTAVTHLVRLADTPATPQRANQVGTHLNSIRTNIQTTFLDFGYPRIKQIFRSEANTAIDSVKIHAREAVADLTREFENEKATLKEEIKELSKSLSKENKRVSNQQTTIDGLIESVSNLTATVKADANVKASAFDNLIGERQTQLDNWKDGIEISGDEYLERIQKLYRLAGDTTLAGRFIQAAKSEERGYWGTSLIAAILFGLAIYFLVFDGSLVDRALEMAMNDPLVMWLSRLSLLAVFMIPAGVFSQMASKHRRASVWYRTIGVRVATLKPYLDEVNSDEGYKVELKEITKSFFTSEMPLDSRVGSKRSNYAMSELESDLDLLSKMKEFLSK